MRISDWSSDVCSSDLMAAAGIEVARGQVLELLGGKGRLVFTSGATEAINMGLIGGAKAMRDRDPDRTKIVTIDTDNAAVRDSVLSLEEQGFEPVLLPVAPDGSFVMVAGQAVLDERNAMVAGILVEPAIGVIP